MARRAGAARGGRAAVPAQRRRHVLPRPRRRRAHRDGVRLGVDSANRAGGSSSGWRRREGGLHGRPGPPGAPFPRRGPAHLILATVAGRDRLRGAAWDSMETADRMVASYAVGSAMRLASTWGTSTPANSPHGWAATPSRTPSPARTFARSCPRWRPASGPAWQLVLEVRAQVRQLGPDAEEVAQWIAPSWRADLRDLVFASLRCVAAVTQQGHTQ